MNCACHGEPAYWAKDVRYNGGGHWECSVKRREYNRQRYLNPARWAQRRRHDLQAQRGRMLDKLSQLQEEARQFGA